MRKLGHKGENKWKIWVGKGFLNSVLGRFHAYSRRMGWRVEYSLIEVSVSLTVTASNGTFLWSVFRFGGHGFALLPRMEFEGYPKKTNRSCLMTNFNTFLKCSIGFQTRMQSARCFQWTYNYCFYAIIFLARGEL